MRHLPFIFEGIIFCVDLFPPYLLLAALFEIVKFAGSKLVHCAGHSNIYSYLEEYNLVSKAPMRLVMFKFAVEHISRVSRVLKQDNGHLLLAGLITTDTWSLLLKTR